MMCLCVHDKFIYTRTCFMMSFFTCMTGAIALWKCSLNNAFVESMVIVHHNSSQIRAQLWPKLSTPGLFQTSAWHYTELEFRITSNWLCTSQKSFGKAAACGASGFSGFRDLAHDGSDRILVFIVSLQLNLWRLRSPPCSLCTLC